MIVVVPSATRLRLGLRNPCTSQLTKHSLCLSGFLNKVALVAMSSVDNSDMRVRRLLAKNVCLRACNLYQFIQSFIFIVEETTAVKLRGGAGPMKNLRYIKTTLMQLLVVPFPFVYALRLKIPHKRKKTEHFCT